MNVSGETMCDCGHRFAAHTLDEGCSSCSCQIPRACDVWPPPFKQYGPGVYHDPRDDTLHFDIPAVLRHLGVTDTPENRTLCTKIAQDVARERFPDTPQIVV